MMAEWVHRFAAWLLRFSVELAPAEVRPWGDAMLSELRFVEGSWAVFSWAAGGSALFLKKTLLALLTGSGGSATSPVPASGFDEEGAMKKLWPWVARLSLAVSLLLLLTPVVRQGLSVVAWGWGLELRWLPWVHRERQSLAAQARAESDAGTLAFLALQSTSSEERASQAALADEAVKIDPSLTWIYSSLADHMVPVPETPRWIEQLGRWDPDNAVPKLVAADRIFNQVVPLAPFGKLETTLAANPQWREEMAAAFRSPRYDSYFGKLCDLDREVLPRRGLNQPMAVMSALAAFGFPRLDNIEAYEKVLVAEGGEFEATGDWKRAAENYRTVVHFGQVMTLGSSINMEKWVANLILAEGSAHLEPLARREGNAGEAAWLAYQAAQWKSGRDAPAKDYFWRGAYAWDARIVGDASLVMILMLALGLVSGVYFLILRLRSRTPTDRGRRIAGGLGVGAAAGLLISSLAVYLAYRPFADIYQHFLLAHGGLDIRAMLPFFSFWGPTSDLMWFFESGWLAVAFWYALIAAGLIVVALMTKRLVQRNLKARPVG